MDTFWIRGKKTWENYSLPKMLHDVYFSKDLERAFQRNIHIERRMREIVRKTECYKDGESLWLLLSPV